MNANQLAAVTSTAPWQLVVAGPGSGKTTVIVARAKHLVEHCAADPRQMAFVTFTNVGAHVLRGRLLAALGVQVSFVGTLHALLLGALRRNDPTWTMVGEEDAEEFIARHAKLLNYRGTAEALVKARTHPIGDPAALRVIRSYQTFMRREHLLDFDMVLTEGLKLIEAAGADRSVVPWQILFVDEFQDSAPVDAAVYLALNPARLMVVGDPDQAVYEFRGARLANVTDYWNNPRFERHVLDLNYRCGSAICAAAQVVIEQNTDRIAKVTISATPVTGLVVRTPCTDEPAERRAVTLAVQAWLAGTAPTEIAVLCRTNKLATQLREALKRAGVPLAEVESEGRPKDWRLLTLLLTLLATPGNWGVARLLAREQAKLLKTSVSDAEEAVEVGRAMGRLPGAMWDFSSVPAILACNADFHRYGVSKATHQALADRIRLTAPATLDDLLAALREPGSVVVRTGATVSTVHAAKGTEYDCVVVAGTDLFSADDEGRRLMFVALTRARFAVTCTSSTERTILLPNGRTLVTAHS